MIHTIGNDRLTVQINEKARSSGPFALPTVRSTSGREIPATGLTGR